MNFVKVVKSGWRDAYTVGELKNILEDALNLLSQYEDDQICELHNNTYGLSDLVLSVKSMGLIDLNNPINTEKIGE